MPDPSEADMDQPGMKDLAASIQAMVQDLSLEEVSEIFSVVFSGLEGGAEQMKSYEEPEQDPEPEEFETLYTPGAEGRPVAGFKLQELMSLIKEVLGEGHYRDMGGPDELYNVLDPEGLEQMSDEDIKRELDALTRH